MPGALLIDNAINMLHARLGARFLYAVGPNNEVVVVIDGQASRMRVHHILSTHAPHVARTVYRLAPTMRWDEVEAVALLGGADALHLYF